MHISVLPVSEMFTEHLLCAEHLANCWKCSNSHHLCPSGVSVLGKNCQTIVVALEEVSGALMTWRQATRLDGGGHSLRRFPGWGKGAAEPNLLMMAGRMFQTGNSKCKGSEEE